MYDLRQIVVNEHLNDLRREAEERRMERTMRHRPRDGESEIARAPARVRLGHWLIGVGKSVAGSAADPGSTAPSVR